MADELDPDMDAHRYERTSQTSSLSEFVLPQLEQSVVDVGADTPIANTREPEFIKWRNLWNSGGQQGNRRPEQRVDDVRCMFNMVHSIARPVLQQDAGQQEATVAPRTADQLLLDLQQLGLVRDKAGHGGAAEDDAPIDGQTDRSPILKDLKQVQEIPMEHPVFHCFLHELCIDRRVPATFLITVEQYDDGFRMLAYEEPSASVDQQKMSGVELVRFPKFPPVTDGFCLSNNGESVVFTCTLLGCVLHVSLSSCSFECEAAVAAAAAAASAMPELEGGGGGANEFARRQSRFSGRREIRDTISRKSSMSSVDGGMDQMFMFRSNRPVIVTEANYKMSELISEHVYDVCIRDGSNAAGTGTGKCNLYVTNKSNIAVISMAGLKLDNFLFEGLKLPWRLKLHKHLLIIAEKWGSVQVADLEKEHRSMCVMDLQGLRCENGLKSIEVVPEHNLLLLTVYPEGNQSAGRYIDELSVSDTVADAYSGISNGLGVGGRVCGQQVGDNAGEDGWSCHCFHFNPDSTHGNAMLRYAQTLRLNRSPLTCVYSEASMCLYVLCFHPARNNCALLMMKLEVFHEDRGHAQKFTAKQFLLQKDEDEYKAAIDGLAKRPAPVEAAKCVETQDSAGAPLVATMKRSITFGFM